MKNFVVVMCLISICSACNAEQPTAKREKKKVCISVYDAKINKEVEKFRTMKIHEKYEGTKVLEKK